jgi:superfamily II DNA or RNA helicase
MPFRDLNLKPGYDSGTDNLVEDFYIPLLKESVVYDRIAGFFTSSSLAIAAEGIAGLIKNNGKMRLLVCPKLSEEDAEMIKSCTLEPQKVIEQCMLKEIRTSNLEDSFANDHVDALGWLLCNGLLEMKVATMVCPLPGIEPLFHQKVAVLRDKTGDVISFSGSINETSFAWLYNSEEFKVFKSWESGQLGYVKGDIQKFNDYWNARIKNTNIYNLPEAVKENLIERSKKFNIEKLSLENYILRRSETPVKDRLSLFPYQKKAVQKWKDNNQQLMFEMATGTGKTRTAIACINSLLEKKEKTLIVISCPESTLSRQWVTEINNLGLDFDYSLFADGTSDWRNTIDKSIKELEVGLINSLIIYTTHTTGCTYDFVNLLDTKSDDIIKCFVGDEAHGLGAKKTRLGLMKNFPYRIGLSATPKRWFDDTGTQIIYDYFGNNSFDFSISDALCTRNPLTGRPFLVKYYYKPIFVTLNDEEMEQYIQLTNKIRNLHFLSKNSDEYEELYENLLFERSRIIKNAESKYGFFKNLIDELKAKNTIEDTLIFTSEGQISKVLLILKEAGVLAHRFTEHEGTKKEKQYGGISERSHLIKCFKENKLQALVAIGCLDEGIDIPTADTAILLANSGNCREYIQRIGRVIRTAPGKTHANIYDFIVVPLLSFSNTFEDIKEFEKIIFEKELKRVMEISKNARNNQEVVSTVNNLYRRLFINGSRK